jgi:hypothetical protein
MFHCYSHGWSHFERTCPLCYGFDTSTSESTSGSIKIMSTEIDLRTKIDHLETELKMIKAERDMLFKKIQDMMVFRTKTNG